MTKYDALGRPYEDIQHEWNASTSTFGATRTWKTSWDFLDRAWASEDPLGVRFEQEFDGRGRLDWEKRVAAGGGSSHTTDYQYHTTNGTLWKVVDAEGAVTQFDTDPLDFNRLLKTTYADGRFEEIDSRDSYGRITGLSDSRTDLVRTLTYSYGRLVSDVATWGSNNNIAGPAKLTWEYDIEDREVTSKVFTESGGAYTQVWETHRDFNWIGELVSETQGAGSDAMTWGFESGYSGELRRVDYPTGLGLTKGVFQYSDDGRPLSAEYHDSALVADYQFAFHGGRLATRTDLQSDIRLETGYDGWGHLTKVEWAHDNGSTWDLLDGQERAFDTASRVIARKRSIDTNGEVFEHDAFGRLEDWYQGVPNALSHTPGSAPSTWGTLESYDLNKVYARTQVTKQVSGQSATTETYGSTGGAHFYDTVPDGQGGTKGRSEYEGYLSDDSDYLFRYDAWGRLTEVERKSDNTIIREHLYDASGRRVRTTDDSGQATRYLYWGSRLAAQFDEGASPANIRTYGYAGGGDSEAFVVNTGAGSANGTFDLARDFQGSILALTDRSTGAVVERYRYSAFGEVSIEDGQGTVLTISAYANDRFFMGRPLDLETGYYDVRARWYDPRTGSFISPDPWGAVDSWNLYQYGFATPGTWLDPLGLSAQEPGQDPVWDSAISTLKEHQFREQMGLEGHDDATVNEARETVGSWLEAEIELRGQEKEEARRIAERNMKIAAFIAEEILWAAVGASAVKWCYRGYKLNQARRAAKAAKVPSPVSPPPKPSGYPGSTSAPKPKQAGGTAGGAAGQNLSIDALSAAGREPARNGATRAGREYQKHMDRGELPKVPGKNLNDAGQELLDDILTNPGTTVGKVTGGRAKGGTRYVRPDGTGATFTPNGKLLYFGKHK